MKKYYIIRTNQDGTVLGVESKDSKRYAKFNIEQFERQIEEFNSKNEETKYKIIGIEDETINGCLSLLLGDGMYKTAKNNDDVIDTIETMKDDLSNIEMTISRMEDILSDLNRNVKEQKETF